MRVDLLRRLAALNLPAEAFQAVLSIIADLQEADETRREKSRQRTSRWRHGNATVTKLERHGNVGGDVTPPSPKVPPITPLNTPPPARSEPKKVLRSLPADFVCDLGYAESKGWARERAIVEAQRFRDHALAKDSKYKDWQAAWRNWVTSPYQPAANGHARPEPKEPLSPERVESLLERHKQRLVETGWND